MQIKNAKKQDIGRAVSITAIDEQIAVAAHTEKKKAVAVEPKEEKKPEPVIANPKASYVCNWSVRCNGRLYEKGKPFPEKEQTILDGLLQSGAISKKGE